MKKLAVILAVLFCAGVMSAQQKIAVIDLQTIFTGYEKTRSVEETMNQQLEIYKEYSARLMKEYKALGDEFNKLRDESQNVALSEAERENRKVRALEKAEQIKRKETEITDYNKTRQKQLKDSFEAQRRTIIREIRKVVQNKAILEGWTLILDKSGISLNDIPVVLYNSPEIDLTQSILDELNRTYRSESKKQTQKKTDAKKK